MKVGAFAARVGVAVGWGASLRCTSPTSARSLTLSSRESGTFMSPEASKVPAAGCRGPWWVGVGVGVPHSGGGV